MLYKLENGCLTAPPKNGYLTNGTAVSGLNNYLANNLELAAQEGYYPLLESVPSENDNVCTYELIDDVIVQTWSTVESEVVE